jgi:tetratricopeptide (TPR) repeat protein
MNSLLEISPNVWVFDGCNPDDSNETFDAALELFDVGNFNEAESKLRGLLLVHPEHIDALHILALLYAQTGRQFESYLCAREAVRIGLDSFPPSFSWLTSRLNWGHLENRPFMRAYHGLGVTLLRDRGCKVAIEIFARLVAVNPNDNLGARYVLMQCHLGLADWQAALALSQRYPDDIGPDITYSKAVALANLGRSEEALNCLNLALQYRPNVAKELLKSRHVRPKSEFPGSMTIGGAEEAFDYWERNGIHWTSGAEVMTLLKKIVPK